MDDRPDDQASQNDQIDQISLEASQKSIIFGYGPMFLLILILIWTLVALKIISISLAILLSGISAVLLFLLGLIYRQVLSAFLAKKITIIVDQLNSKESSEETETSELGVTSEANERGKRKKRSIKRKRYETRKKKDTKHGNRKA